MIMPARLLLMDKSFSLRMSPTMSIFSGVSVLSSRTRDDEYSRKWVIVREITNRCGSTSYHLTNHLLKRDRKQVFDSVRRVARLRQSKHMPRVEWSERCTLWAQYRIELSSSISFPNLSITLLGVHLTLSSPSLTGVSCSSTILSKMGMTQSSNLQ